MNISNFKYFNINFNEIYENFWFFICIVFCNFHQRDINVIMLKPSFNNNPIIFSGSVPSNQKPVKFKGTPHPQVTTDSLWSLFT